MNSYIFASISRHLYHLFIIQQICTKSLVRARHCGRCGAYSGKQHRHSFQPHGVQFMWISMCKRHHDEVGWGSLWRLQCNLTFPLPAQPASLPSPPTLSGEKSLGVYFTFLCFAWCREQSERQSPGFNCDTKSGKRGGDGPLQPLSVLHSMLP